MTPPASHQTTSDEIRRAGRDMLSLALMDARNHTLRLLAQFESALAAPHARVPDGMESPTWIAGHIAWLAEWWIVRNPQRALGPRCPADGMRLASIDPEADGRWDPALASDALRRELDANAFEPVRAYLLETLEGTLDLLERTDEADDALHFFRAALWHEEAQGEELAVLAQAMGVPLALPAVVTTPPREPLLMPAARWQFGSAPGGYVPHLERWAHEVQVPEFEIDAQPVTWAQYAEFVDDGGYDREALWSRGGWSWLATEGQREGRRAPRHVEQIGSASQAVVQSRFGRTWRRSAHDSVMHASWWEAEAWARWAGRRLPTEVEWELAAHPAARRGFRWGDVREWTAGTLRPFPGFEPDAWTRHTRFEAAPQFGRARAVRGASFATPARLRHAKQRWFALPEADTGFLGFRTCAP